MSPSPHPRFPRALLAFWLRRTALMWCLIAPMIALVQISTCGVVHDNENVKALLNMIKLMPSFVQTMLGGNRLDAANVATIVAIGYQHPFVLLLFMVFAVGVPTGLLTGEIQRGTMELILSRPATRLRVYFCAALVTLGGMFMLTMAMFMGTVIGTRWFGLQAQVPLWPFFLGAINGGMLASAVGAIALMAAAALRTRGGAVGVAVAFLVLNYFIAIFSAWWPPMRGLFRWTLFSYVNLQGLIHHPAWPVRNMVVLGGVMAVALTLGALVWRRRDLPL